MEKKLKFLDRLHRRFDRIGELVGDKGMQCLSQTHVLVVGVGGVGSFAAESLVRSGVGKVTLVDFDLVWQYKIQIVSYKRSKVLLGSPKPNCSCG